MKLRLLLDWCQNQTKGHKVASSITTLPATRVSPLAVCKGSQSLESNPSPATAIGIMYTKFNHCYKTVNIYFMHLPVRIMTATPPPKRSREKIKQKKPVCGRK